MPINLESGESKIFYIKLNIRCAEKASNAIKSEIEIGEKGKYLPISKIHEILKKNKLDFYDNSIEKLVSEYRIKKQQSFVIKFKTATREFTKRVYYNMYPT